MGGITKTYKFDCIFQGLRYLHTSEIGCHGNLKSSNCLVDARWKVRLSAYGLHMTRQGEVHDTPTQDHAARG